MASKFIYLNKVILGIIFYFFYPETHFIYNGTKEKDGF